MNNSNKNFIINVDLNYLVLIRLMNHWKLLKFPAIFARTQNDWDRITSIDSDRDRKHKTDKYEAMKVA